MAYLGLPGAHSSMPRSGFALWVLVPSTHCSYLNITNEVETSAMQELQLLRSCWAAALVQESSPVVTALRASPNILWSSNFLPLGALLGWGRMLHLNWLWKGLM